jgi:hypothetical protein
MAKLKIGTLEVPVSANGWEQATLDFIKAGVITRAGIKGFLSKTLDQPWLFKDVGKKSSSGEKAPSKPRKAETKSNARSAVTDSQPKPKSKKKILSAQRQEVIDLLASWAAVPDMSGTKFQDLRKDPANWNAALQQKVGLGFFSKGADGNFTIEADERKAKFVECLQAAGIPDSHRHATFAVFPQLVVPKKKSGPDETKSQVGNTLIVDEQVQPLAGPVPTQSECMKTVNDRPVVASPKIRLSQVGPTLMESPPQVGRKVASQIAK